MVYPAMVTGKENEGENKNVIDNFIITVKSRSFTIKCDDS